MVMFQNNYEDDRTSWAAEGTLKYYMDTYSIWLYILSIEHP